MFCNECKCPAEDIYDLGEHMFEIHSSRYEGEGHYKESGSTDSMQSDGFTCNFCEEKFVKHGGLMNHKKTKHRDKVAICWKFSAGNCSFGDAYCWFLHSEYEESCTSPEWKCNFCDNEFRCQSELLRHKKKEHGHLVKMCRNGENGKCVYESQDCWFRHSISERAFEIDKATNEQNEVIEKVFGMLEKMTERILQIENYNLTK